MMRIPCRLAVLLGLCAWPAFAQQTEYPLQSTRDLLAICGAERVGGDFVERINYCRGFIAGNGLLYDELLAARAIARPWVCAPPRRSIDEIRSAFVDWAKANPQHHGDKPVDGFWRAMAAKWPCK